MSPETIDRHTTIAFDLMCALRHDQNSQAYIHAAKAWMALDTMNRKAKRDAKKKAPDITAAQIDELAAAAGLPKVGTPNTGLAPPQEAAGTTPKRAAAK